MTLVGLGLCLTLRILAPPPLGDFQAPWPCKSGHPTMWARLKRTRHDVLSPGPTVGSGGLEI